MWCGGAHEARLLPRTHTRASACVRVRVRVFCALKLLVSAERPQQRRKINDYVHPYDNEYYDLQSERNVWKRGKDSPIQ